MFYIHYSLRLSLLLFLFTALSLSAQDEQILPRGFADGERALIPAYNAARHTRVADCEFDAPDAETLRSIAEWEELQAVAITWTAFPVILTEIVAAVKQECEVIIICSNEAVVKNQLGAAGVDWTTGITFIEDDFNSIWIRDYGPNTVYLNDVETLAFVDWIYNRPRPKDDVIPEVISDAMGIPIYCTHNAPNDLVHTGGNYMTDGLGMGFSSKLVLQENGPNNTWGISNHSEEEVEQIMEDYMGIATYPKMTVLPYDLIHHIDMHMKLLDETTLLVGQYPEGIADGPQIEANIQFILDNYTTSYGTPFKVIRIPMPPENGAYPNTFGDYRTYANALFVNKTILVPTYEPQYDQEALAIWEEAMPGYNIVGIDCNDIIPLSGALHCITKEIGVDHPLWISHEPLRDQDPATNVYPVAAQIKHIDGVAAATLYYKTDLAAAYTSVNMSLAANDIWTADIPGQAAGTTVYYYIHAQANDGKEQVRPMPAPEGYFRFVVGELTSTTGDNATLKQLSIQPIFPNPAAAITCIPVTNAKEVEATLSIADALGKTVKVLFEGNLPKGESKYFFYAGDMAAGVYFVQLITAKGQVMERVVVH